MTIEVAKIVEEEMIEFKKFSTKQKLAKISTDFNRYFETSQTANYYSRKNKESDKFKQKFELAEYSELLSEIRLRKKIQSLDKNEIKALIEALSDKVQLGASEKDLQKRFKINDYVTLVCQFCSSEDKEIIDCLKKLKEESLSLIREIPTM